MSDLTVFNFKSNQVRVVSVNGEPWFVAKDVCDVLEIQNTTQAMSKLDEDERSMFNIGRQGETNIVNEYGLYGLILTSRKPEAKAFKRWITHEVLPSIRKTGSYSLSPVPTDNRAMLKSVLDDMWLGIKLFLCIIEKDQALKLRLLLN